MKKEVRFRPPRPKPRPRALRHVRHVLIEVLEEMIDTQRANSGPSEGLERLEKQLADMISKAN
jgi:hypothetical protein